ncbi:MAG: transposase [Saprospiraceae bacterium]
MYPGTPFRGITLGCTPELRSGAVVLGLPRNGVPGYIPCPAIALNSFFGYICNMEKQFYRRNLPHWQISEATYFVTYRLYGSIPRAVIEQMKADYQAAITAIERECTPELRSGASPGAAPEQSSRVQPSVTPPEQSSRVLRIYGEQKRYFARFDALLDQNPNGPYWLQQPEIAQINWDALLFYHDKLYRMYAFCIMSNHIHVLFEALPGAPPLEIIMGRLKRYTGVHCNKLLGRTGNSFWESESYDHIVRAGEFDRILAYILNNPVKAKQVSSWKDWKWTYCASEFV